MPVGDGSAHARAKRPRKNAAFMRGDEVALLIRVGVDETRQNPDRGLLHKPYAPKKWESNQVAGVKPHVANISGQTSGIDPWACLEFRLTRALISYF
jgi:hypothetical protein